MTREEYFKFHEEMTRRMNEITRAKNADYTGATGDDPFSNFSRVGSLGVCSTEQGFMVRILDKYMRINSFVQKGFLHVKDESVEDTLLDLANYAILFAGYLKSTNQKDDVSGTTLRERKDVCVNCNADSLEVSHWHEKFGWLCPQTKPRAPEESPPIGTSATKKAQRFEKLARQEGITAAILPEIQSSYWRCYKCQSPTRVNEDQVCAACEEADNEANQ